jgi:hypothetical protein
VGRLGGAPGQSGSFHFFGSGLELFNRYSLVYLFFFKLISTISTIYEVLQCADH